ncbi:hypothetical protein ACLOJK_003668 [Asimina triloba]
MTSASELFYSRRSRIGRNPELGFDLSLDRLPPTHHSRRTHHRHDEDCHPFRRSSHGPSSLNPRHHPCHRISQTLETDPARLDHGTRQSGTGNSSVMPTSNDQTNRRRFTRNDRLPGAVLQARARLLERLRGVSLTGNRHSSRAADISWDEFAVSDDFRVVDTGGDWDSDILRDLSQSTTPFITLIRGEPSSPLLDTTKKKPPGLTPVAINSLQHEVFNVADGDEVVCAECCICLESFQEGDDSTHPALIPGYKLVAIALTAERASWFNRWIEERMADDS